MKSSERFLPYIHRMRGVAILMIVAAHCASFFAWTRWTTFGNSVKDAMDNSTLTFVFISGFLFQYLSGSFSYPKYLGRKARNVVAPYIIMSFPAVYLALTPSDPDVLATFPKNASLAYRIGWLYLHPGFNVTYAMWYMPVIMIFFLAAPAFMMLIEKPRLYWILALLVPISVFGQRPTYAGNHNLQLALYYASAYVAGMLFSQFRTKLVRIARDRWVVFGSVSLAILVAYINLSDIHGTYSVSNLFAFDKHPADWVYVQKCFFCIFLVGLLVRFDAVSMAPLDYLAGASFTIYLTHLYVIYAVAWFFRFERPEGDPLRVLMLFIVAVGLSCAVASVGRLVFRGRSRMIVGS